MEQKGNIEHVVGLRGLSALVLVLFYLNSTAWPLGYLGIDMFLVITGYLLFSSRRAYRGDETLRDSLFFIVRRLQKIIPSVAIVILVSVVAGAFLLWWEDEYFLSELGLSSCLGRANVMLAEVTGREAAAETTFVPITHLWYISALVQVYLIWCVGNQALQRCKSSTIIGVLSVVALVSLVYCNSYALHEWLAKGGIRMWEQSAPPSEYEVLPRLWEVLLGGVVTLMPSLKGRRIAAMAVGAVGVVCLATVLLAGVIPGIGSAVQAAPCSLIAVVGTVLCIRYLPVSGMGGLFTNRAMKWLGSISFPLYLVGLPIFVFGMLWMPDGPGTLQQAALLAVALLAAWGLRRGIEKREVMPEVVLGLWAGAFLLCGAGTLTEGFRNYVPAVTINIPTHEWVLCRDHKLCANWDPSLDFSREVFKYLNASEPKDTFHGVPLLVIGDQNRPAGVALIGDTHAAHLYAGLHEFFRQENISGVYVSSIFFPFHNWKQQNNSAKEQALLYWLRTHPQIRHVIIGQRWATKLRHVARLSGQPWANDSRFEIDLRAFLRELNNMGKQVIIVAPTPEFDMKPLQHYCKVLSFRGMNVADIAPVCPLADHLARNSAVMTVLHKLEKEKLCTILDPVTILGEGEGFLAAADNTLLMRDSHHMYAEHSIYLIERLVKPLRQMLGINSDKPFIPTRKSTDQRTMKHPRTTRHS